MGKAIIVGSGIAGLAGAIRLRNAGYEVAVYEANSSAGGKITSFSEKGYHFDMGPSLFTMPELVVALFRLCNVDPGKHFSYMQKDTACHYFWNENTPFKAPANVKSFSQQASTYFSEPEKTIRDYLRRSAYKYNKTEPLFLEKSLHRVSTYLNSQTLEAIGSIPKLDIFSTLHEVNSRTFENRKLVQLFDRFATYNGSSPYQTPGIMSMIPHLEVGKGTYYPSGGMRSIPEALYQLAKHCGVQFHFNSFVDEIIHHEKAVTGIRIGEEHIHADVVVSNMDVFSCYRTLLKSAKQPKKVLKQERSSSGIIFYWGIQRQFPELDLHNIFFSGDYGKEFHELFTLKKVPEDPTIYVNITSKQESHHAPENSENWFVMVNAPGNTGQDWEVEIKLVKEKIIKRLSTVLGVDIAPLIEYENFIDPRKIEQNTHSHQGSLYGTSSNSRNAAFNRHPNRSQQFKNLFFCGGSVHPGGGIPLCLKSAEITVDWITSERS